MAPGPTRIEKTGLAPHHFLYAIVGSPGMGKTSILTSLLCASGEKSRLYRGCFDTIYFCCSETSLRSIKSDPFSSIDSSQFYDEFNEDFLSEMRMKVEENSDKNEDTLIVIDDACNRLKSMTNEFCNLLLVHRHLRFSLIVLIYYFYIFYFLVTFRTPASGSQSITTFLLSL